MKLYPVVHWPDSENKAGVVCLCQTKADAEEMVLTFTESQPYDEYLEDLYHFPIVNNYHYEFMYNPLKDHNSNYFIDAPVKVLS